MKKKSIILFLLIIFFMNKNVRANAYDDLKMRLNKVGSFYAIFMHKITDNNGNIIQKNQGDLWFKRPNLFNWHIKQPDESILISDGKTLWIYNPLVKQVTAIWIKDVTNNILFKLIICYQSKDWKKYDISQNGDNFFLKPKSNNSNLKKFTINVDRNGTIHQFITIDPDGQSNSYELKSHHNGKINTSKFNFILHPGITMDDQRN